MASCSGSLPLHTSCWSLNRHHLEQKWIQATPVFLRCVQRHQPEEDSVLMCRLLRCCSLFILVVHPCVWTVKHQLKQTSFGICKLFSDFEKAALICTNKEQNVMSHPFFFCLFGHIKGDEQNPSLCTPIWPLRHAVEQDPECENTSPEQADFSCIFIETLCYETSPVHYWTGLLLIFASAVASWLGRPHRCWLVNTDLSKHLVPKAPTWERGWRWCQGNRGPFRLRSGCSGIVWIQSQTAEGIRAFSLKQII